MRELAHPLPAAADQLAQRGQLVAGVAPPVREQVGAQPQGQRRVAGEVPGVEQAERDPGVGAGRVGDLRERPHRVVEVRAGVPERVPDLLGDPAHPHLGVPSSCTSTTSRSLCGASSERP